MTATFVLLLLHARLGGGKGRDMGYRCLWCIALWTLLMLGMTEGLSLVHLLRFRVLWLCWGGVAAALAVLYLVRRLALKKAGALPAFTRPRAAWLPAVLPVLALAALAVHTVPYNFDSMNYGLSRVAHWAQEGSVAHYATNIVRQLAAPNLTEFIDLHVYILCAKNDIFINLPQAAAHVACAGFVYGISRKLGCDVWPSALAGLLCFGMPVAFAAAFSTQPDGFAALWLLGFAYVLLDFTHPGDRLCFDAPTRGRAVLLGLLAALGCMTAPSAGIGILLLAVWLAAVCMARRDDARVIGKLILCALPAVVLPLLPEAARNLQTFGAFAGPDMVQDLLVGSADPAVLLVNLCRNLAVNMPTRLIDHSEQAIQPLVQGLAGLLGVPERGSAFRLSAAPGYWQGSAISPLVFYAAMAAFIFAVIRRRRAGTGSKGLVYSYSFTVLLVYLVFCTVLGWEPSGSHYLLGYLALLCPAVACALQRLQKPENKALCASLLALLCATELFSLGMYHSEVTAGNGPRPLGYFGANTAAAAPYMDLCQMMVESGSREWGLVLREEDYEYPLWYMAKINGAHLTHMQVENVSAQYEDMTCTPDYVFWAGELPAYTLPLHGAQYELVTMSGEFSLLIRSDFAAP